MSIEVTQGYCPKSGNNTLVTVGDLKIYFSYTTPIACKYGNNELVVRENTPTIKAPKMGTTTTGKHLNAINPDKKSRISGQKFEQIYQDALRELGLTEGELI